MVSNSPLRSNGRYYTSIISCGLYSNAIMHRYMWKTWPKKKNNTWRCNSRNLWLLCKSILWFGRHCSAGLLATLNSGTRSSRPQSAFAKARVWTWWTEGQELNYLCVKRSSDYALVDNRLDVCNVTKGHLTDDSWCTSFIRYTLIVYHRLRKIKQLSNFYNNLRTPCTFSASTVNAVCSRDLGKSFMLCCRPMGRSTRWTALKKGYPQGMLGKWIFNGCELDKLVQNHRKF